MTLHNQDVSLSVDQHVTTLLGKMTLAEKIGQMTQVEKFSITPEDVTNFNIGSILSGGGGNPDPNNVTEWRNMVQSYMEAALKTRLEIPLIYGVDAVHGHNNVIGATIFPHNIGLGATRSPDVVRRIGHATASEILATNVHWNFAPAVSVPRDLRWGRTYEGYSEDTAVVSELGAAYVAGLQSKQANGDWALASVKHYVGDGATEWDSPLEVPAATNPDTDFKWAQPNNWQAPGADWRIDQGNVIVDEEALRRDHLAPYIKAIEAGAQNIMVSFSSWQGVKMHAHRYMLTDVLKGEYGFEGFLVSDWFALSQLSSSAYEGIVQSINAGLDMIMVPFDYKTFIQLLTKAVENGDVAMERIDDAVSRILRVKFMLGLFEASMTSEKYVDTFGGAMHRSIAREAVQKSLVLLKNENNTLPLVHNKTIGVAGVAADDIGLACGGWTIEWQGGSGALTPGTTLLEGLQNTYDEQCYYAADGNFESKLDIAFVTIAETPTAEGVGDREDLAISPEHVALIRKVREQCDRLVLIIYSGRPQIITEIVDDCDAIVAAWLPGTEAGAISEVINGEVPFTGKLPFAWIRSMEQVPYRNLQSSSESPLWEFGFGLSY